MKKVFLIFLLVFGSQILSSHPGVEGHTHETAYGELAWLVLPIIALFILVRIQSKLQSNKF